MVQTIGNPVSWGLNIAQGTGDVLRETVDGMSAQTDAQPNIHKLTFADIRAALRQGFTDLADSRSDVMALVMIYPLIGVALSFFAFNQALLPLIFPMAAGFTLLGPLAAIGLYEMSRRKELGAAGGWIAALSGLRSRIVGPMIVLGLYLLVIYVTWLGVAWGLYMITLGPEAPTSLGAFANDLFATRNGWILMIFGPAIGFLFAGLVLATTFIAFPMMIDRRVGIPTAMGTSWRVVMQNQAIVALWGVIVAAVLAIASIPFFLGLIIALPVLGHATWHLYRKAVSYE